MHVRYTQSQIPGTEGICVLQELGTEMMSSKSTIVARGRIRVKAGMPARMDACSKEVLFYVFVSNYRD